MLRNGSSRSVLQEIDSRKRYFLSSRIFWEVILELREGHTCRSFHRSWSFLGSLSFFGLRSRDPK